MLNFFFRKLWKRRWLILCLLMGNILLVGTVAATPMYNMGTMSRILRNEMRNKQAETNTFPAVVQFTYPFNQVSEERRITGYYDNKNRWLPQMLDEIGIPVYKSIRVDTMGRWAFVPAVEREARDRSRNLEVTAISGISDLVELTYGRLPSPGWVNGNTIEVLASDFTLFNHNLLVDELMAVTDVYMHQPEGQIYVRIVGIYEPAPGSEIIWSTLNIRHEHVLFMDDYLLHNHFIPNYIIDYRLTTRWMFALNTNTMIANKIPQYLQGLDIQHIRFSTYFRENISETLNGHNEQVGPLSTTLLVLQVPMFIMLALYIYMVSRQILQLEQNDISVIKSRGASRSQILGLYILQGLFVAVVALPAGLYLAMGICHLLGASNGFMELVQRAALTIEITPEVILYAGTALLFSFFAMILPVIGFSKVTIVTHKRTKSGKPRKPFWQRYGLDILCFVVSVYIIYNFNMYTDQITEMASAGRAFDPLLLLGSSLFIIGFGLFCLRIFPYIVRIVFYAGRRFWPPSVYASLLKVIRSAGEEQFIMIFLVFTLAIGIFSAQTARTLNLNYDHEVHYTIGADIVFLERWRDNTISTQGGGSTVPPGDVHVYIEPSIKRFVRLDEVTSIAPVLRLNTATNLGQGVMQGIRFMGIETESFGETVWFRDDLLQVHINHYLNTLALQPNGVLLSKNFMEYGFSVGDLIRIPSPHHPFREVQNVSLLIVGFVDHFPGFIPYELLRLRTGVYIAEEQFLAVANLGYINQMWGVLPYQVWMRTNVESSRFFTDFVAENRIPLIGRPACTHSALIDVRTTPMVQGVNGVLTVNFIITLVVCFSGFLIYWILSIRSRVLQFGIFRAMGMTLHGIIRLLINEQLFITLTALGIGAWVGEMAARNYVPIIQLSYAAAQRPIPLLIVIEIRDYINLYTVMGAMIVLCLIVLLTLVARMRIAQVLKLGED